GRRRAPPPAGPRRLWLALPADRLPARREPALPDRHDLRRAAGLSAVGWLLPRRRCLAGGIRRRRGPAVDPACPALRGRGAAAGGSNGGPQSGLVQRRVAVLEHGPRVARAREGALRLRVHVVGRRSEPS